MSDNIQSLADELKRHLVGFLVVLLKIGSLVTNYATSRLEIGQLSPQMRDRLIGAVIVLALQSIPRGKFKGLSVAALRRLTSWAGSIMVKSEVDPPTESYDFLLRRLEDFQPSLRGDEQASTYKLVASQRPHNSYQVRLFSKDEDEPNYVGMGFRTHQGIVMPKHVATHLKDGFIMKSASRVKVDFIWDDSKVYYDPLSHLDYLIYDFGPTIYAKMGITQARIGQVDKGSRVHLKGCLVPSEFQVHSKGLVVGSSHFLGTHESDYSSQPGHSGAAVTQLVSGAEYVVGMHIQADGKSTLNRFLSSAVFAHNESYGSTGSNDSEFHTQRKAIDLARRLMRMYGEHRFEDADEIEEFRESTQREILEYYAMNDDAESALEDFAYVRSRGWMMRKGKSARRHTNESASKQSLSLKEVQRLPVSLTEKTEKKVSLPNQKSLALSLRSLNPSLEESALSASQTESQTQDESQKPILSESLEGLLKNYSKTAITTALRKISLTPANMPPTPPSEQSKN